MRMSRSPIALCSLALCLVGSWLLAGGDVFANSHANRDLRVRQAMPIFGGMRAEMTAQFEVLAEPKTAERLATFTRNYYQALKAEGFSDAQALALVKSMGFPLVNARSR